MCYETLHRELVKRRITREKTLQTVAKTGNKMNSIKPEYDLHRVTFGCTLMLCEDI
jgi:hypothetical protein